MEELEAQDRPGPFRRFIGIFAHPPAEDEETTPARKLEHPDGVHLRSPGRVVMTVRRQVVTFDDALAAADGLKRGDQQILNLSGTDAVLRQKIVDFMSGVQYSQEATWEEIGDSVYLIAPSTVYVEIAPATPRMTATRN